jgi:hypothetical protein
MSTLAERLVWDDPKLYLDDILFRLQQSNIPWREERPYFRFYKDRKLVDQYDQFLQQIDGFCADHLFELGMFDGGSVVFWNEILHPHKHVAIDLAKRQDNPYFVEYIASRGLQNKIKTFWGIDQSDRKRLHGLLASEFDGRLDLVIDDASHFLAPTKQSFETLFPALRAGGLYIIEDWAWGHWKEFRDIDQVYATETPLTQLVFDLVELIGTSREWISRLTIYQGFVVAERGPAIASQNWSLDDSICRQLRPTASRKAKVLARKALRRFGFLPRNFT